MVDIIKKAILAGVGAAVVTKEKAEAALDEFVRQGKVSSNDAKSMAEKIASDGRREFESAAGELNRRIGDMLSRLDRKTQDRIAALESRVTALEAQVTAPQPPIAPSV